MTEQDKQALIKHFCKRDCGDAAENCEIMPCHEIELIQEFPTTEADSDTISRAKAIAEVEKARAYVGHRYNIESMVGRDIFEMLDNVVSDISKLPSAQPERIKGHWIKISPANIYECSECGKSVMTNDICAYDFCHGCGADMREVTT